MAVDLSKYQALLDGSPTSKLAAIALDILTEGRATIGADKPARLLSVYRKVGIAQGRKIPDESTPAVQHLRPLFIEWLLADAKAYCEEPLTAAEVLEAMGKVGSDAAG